MNRKVNLKRDTAETQIELTLNLDGSGKCRVQTGVPFFDHMMVLFTKHGGFDLELKAVGDGVDNHHVLEDIGILMGKAFADALGDKRGITRYAFAFTPMEDTGQVVEVFDPGFLAKRMEVGAVIAAVPKENVRRECPEPGTHSWGGGALYGPQP